MKKWTKVLLLTAVSAMSSGAFAASLPELVGNDGVAAQERIGTVSVSGVRGSTDNAIAALQKKALDIGGSKIHITALNTPGDSSLWMGVAEVYR